MADRDYSEASIHMIIMDAMIVCQYYERRYQKKQRSVYIAVQYWYRKRKSIAQNAVRNLKKVWHSAQIVAAQ